MPTQAGMEIAEIQSRMHREYCFFLVVSYPLRFPPQGLWRDELGLLQSVHCLAAFGGKENTPAQRSQCLLCPGAEVLQTL